jgi:hypothetical protein
MGPDAGARPQRLGVDSEGAPSTSRGPCHANAGGFDLHAAVAVPAGDRARLEHLARYVLRPPIAQDALSRLPDGRVLLKIRRPWSDGTRGLVFEPLALLARLAALTPRPRVNLLLYHGAFAPRSRLRADAVARAGAAARADSPPPCTSYDQQPDSGTSSSRSDAVPREGGAADVVIQRPADSRTVVPDEARAGGGTSSLEADAPKPRRRGRWFKWADLMGRVFELDVLACPTCGGRLRLIATIDDPAVIRRILGHLGLPTTLERPLPARPPPVSPQTLPFDFP